MGGFEPSPRASELPVTQRVVLRLHLQLIVLSGSRRKPPTLTKQVSPLSGGRIKAPFPHDLKALLRRITGWTVASDPRGPRRWHAILPTVPTGPKTLGIYFIGLRLLQCNPSFNVINGYLVLQHTPRRDTILNQLIN